MSARACVFLLCLAAGGCTGRRSTPELPLRDNIPGIDAVESHAFGVTLHARKPAGGPTALWVNGQSVESVDLRAGGSFDSPGGDGAVHTYELLAFRPDAVVFKLRRVLDLRHSGRGRQVTESVVRVAPYDRREAPFPPPAPDARR